MDKGTNGTHANKPKHHLTLVIVLGVKRKPQAAGRRVAARR